MRIPRFFTIWAVCLITVGGLMSIGLAGAVHDSGKILQHRVVAPVAHNQVVNREHKADRAMTVIFKETVVRQPIPVPKDEPMTPWNQWRVI